MSKRLISQNKRVNVPFDIAIVCASDREVCAYIPGFEEPVHLGKYSTHETAKNVIWLMNYTLAKENTFEFPKEDEVL